MENLDPIPSPPYQGFIYGAFGLSLSHGFILDLRGGGGRVGGGASGGRGGFAVPFHSVSKTVAPSNVIPIWLNTQSCFFDDCVTQIGRINSLSFFASLF